jgi:cell division protein FtsW
MGYLAGLPRNLILGVAGAGVVFFLVLSLRDEYSRARIVTMFDPWREYYGDGYQLIQGFYAFGSGGLFGVGLGFSRQKYSYLPMAYNDFIFAVIGEELGLVGTVGMLAVFALLGWAGFQIAKNAPDLAGRLIAAGCTSLLIIQLLVNIGGVLGMIPLTGKPVPFISYGGSTILSCLMLSGITLSVSRASRLPETVHDQARSRWQVDEGYSAAYGSLYDEDSYEETFVSDPMPRSAREQSPAYGSHPTELARGPFTVVEGGRGASAPRTNSRDRIDLGPSATDRLRGSSNKGKRRR